MFSVGFTPLLNEDFRKFPSISHLRLKYSGMYSSGDANTFSFESYYGKMSIEKIKGKKGYKLKVNHPVDGVKIYFLDFELSDSNKWSLSKFKNIKITNPNQSLDSIRSWLSHFLDPNIADRYTFKDVLFDKNTSCHNPELEKFFLQTFHNHDELSCLSTSLNENMREPLNNK